MGTDETRTSGVLRLASGTVEYYLRSPRGPSGRFSIVKRVRRGKSETVKSEAVEAVNQQFLSHKLGIDEAREAVKREVARLRKLAGGGKITTLRPANLRALERYWEAEFSHRNQVDAPAAKNRLRRAVEALGDTPITASREELQRTVNLAARGNRHRAIVSALNPLLRWLGRTEVKLLPVRKERRRVRYLSLADWVLVAPHVAEPMRTKCWVAFATGLRAGEHYAMTPPRDGVLFVDMQVRRGQSDPAEPKNRRVREVPIIPEGLVWVAAWLALEPETRLALRNKRHADYVRKACKTTFPKQPDKWLTFHDLRHSYAIHLLNLGVPTGLVAQALGDSEAVVQENYVGFVLSQPGIEAIKRLLGGIK